MASRIGKFITDAVKFVLGMDKDTDFPFKNHDSYLDGLNVRHITQGGNTGRSIQNVLGNTLSFTIPPVTVQNKIFRVLVTSEAANSYTWNLLDANNNVLATVNVVATSGNIATTLTTMVTNWTAALTGAGQTFTVITSTVTGTDAGYITVEITTVPTWEYYIVSTGTVESQIIIIQEAIDASEVGIPVVIGSYDLLGDLFIYSSTAANLPATFTDISSVADDGTGQYEITTSGVHSFTDQSAIQISSVTGVAAPNNLNGYWIITVTGPTTFVLNGSQFIAGAVLTNAQYIVNINGYGKIGVAVQSNNSGLWTYTDLLQSKELNFRIQKQIDVTEERNSFNNSCYFTDDYNPIRVFYYSGPYITNGAISAINSVGQYAYGSIGEELILGANQLNIDLSYTTQLQTGGAVLSGNWRYAFRLITESLSATGWSDLGNEINVYDATNIYSSITEAENLDGDDENVTTPKINQFLLSGIIPGLFKYIELAGVNYLDNGALSAQIIKRDLLLGGVTQVIQHTGFETESIDIDPGTLNSIFADIVTAKNINAIDNRLIVSNVTTSALKNFSPFTESFTHSVLRTEVANSNQINGIKFRYDGSLVIAEYQLPETVHSRAGYMLRETYRFGAKFLLKTGAITQVYWIDDIIINDSATNTGNPFGDNRRIAGLPSMDLTDATEDLIYAPYIQFFFDWSFIIDGVPILNLVEKIIIERVVMNEANSNVIASGIAVQGVNGEFSIGTQSMDSNAAIFNYQFTLTPNAQFPPPAPTDYYCDWYFAAGARLDNPIGVPALLDPAYPFMFPAGIQNSNRRCGSFYSPDFITEYNAWTYQSGDQIISYGSPVVIPFGGLSSIEIQGTPLPTDAIYYNNIREFTGNTADAGTAYTLTDMKYIGNSVAQAITGTGNTVNYSKFAFLNIQDGILDQYTANLLNEASPVYGLASDIVHSGAGADYGVLQAQIFRPKVDKFGGFDTSKYISTNSFAVYAGNISGSVNVFGGDVFTQKTYFIHRFFPGLFHIGGPAIYGRPGFNGGMGFYSQNHVNTQMINKDTSPNNYRYPFIGEIEWMNQFNIMADWPNYNHGYDYQNKINSDVAFDPNLPNSGDMPARIYWSDLKLANSPQDNYRIILPLNFKDLDLTQGEIMHHVNMNGELFTWQVRKLQRQFFNTRGILETTTNLSVLIGDGSVMSRDGQTISVIGTTHKWSVIRGKSQGGNDVFYWLNTELKKICRIALDGTVSITDITGMQSFIANNIRWIAEKDNPASGEGVASVWDDRNFEALWTMRGKKEVPAWSDLAAYVPGDVVFYNGVYTTYEQTGEFYTALLPSTGIAPDSDPLLWQLIPHTDNNYYNEYTLAFNEQKNRFTTFYTFKPKIYLKYKDTFLSPDPVNDNDIYLHNVGGYCRWYRGDNEDGQITLVYSGDEDMTKMLHAVLCETVQVPIRVDIYTQNHATFMLSNDFVDMNGQWTAAIKNDTLTSPTGSAEEDTSKLWGHYALIKLTFEQGSFQKMSSVVIKFAPMGRQYNS